jgi:hypothetical protein
VIHSQARPILSTRAFTLKSRQNIAAEYNPLILSGITRGSARLRLPRICPDPQCSRLSTSKVVWKKADWVRLQADGARFRVRRTDRG